MKPLKLFPFGRVGGRLDQARVQLSINLRSGVAFRVQAYGLAVHSKPESRRRVQLCINLSSDVALRIWGLGFGV